jgi:AcrR family transcriptional regulator
MATTDPPVPRRAPQGDARRRDPERSRRLILEAASSEFADKGYAGARVAEIAKRAGVNQQLISYYFGGKQGLYDALVAAWNDREADFTGPDVPFTAMVRGYLDAVLGEADASRFWLRLGLDDPTMGSEPLDEERMDMARRQAEGQVTSRFSPEFIALVSQAATLAPIALPQVVRGLYGLEPDSPEFRARYAAELETLFAAEG